MNMKCKRKGKSKELTTKTDIGWGHQIRSCLTTLPISKRFKKQSRK